jgi:hypothetical protein
MVIDLFLSCVIDRARYHVLAQKQSEVMEALILAMKGCSSISPSAELTILSRPESLFHLVDALRVYHSSCFGLHDIIRHSFDI